MRGTVTDAPATGIERCKTHMWSYFWHYHADKSKPPWPMRHCRRCFREQALAGGKWRKPSMNDMDAPFA